MIVILPIKVNESNDFYQEHVLNHWLPDRSENGKTVDCSVRVLLLHPASLRFTNTF